jgi:hypothetical protein
MNKSLRNTFITIFVIVWTILFHYESTRHFYLEPLFHRPLAQMKFLFPPAGWIMFYNVDDNYGFVEVYGVKDKGLFLIDPHEIFRTRTIGFDNIHRNVLSTVADPVTSKQFCAFLKRRFPEYRNFVIASSYYPSLTKNPGTFSQQIQYQCNP